ncbi:MAG: hypothetical protein QOE41_1340 [Mycobacterium sp.]|jgi:hypothetical protein|nr:hypothetical protein [Mycobacterium sp.]
MTTRTALIVATYEYEDPGLRQLTAPRHDAQDLSEVLRNPAIGGFGEVTTMINESHEVVGEAIWKLYAKSKPGDLTLLYFSGHGLKDDSGKLYLAMKDTYLEKKLWTSVTADQINQSLDDSRSKQKILILDCCYAGAFPSGAVAKADDTVHVIERFSGRGRIVLTASDATQFAFEGTAIPQGSAPQSVFTRHLITGLRDGSADQDCNGDITADELYDYLHQRVTEERPQQRPKMDASVDGRTVIAQNANWALPQSIRNALDSELRGMRLQALSDLNHYFKIGNRAVRGRITKEVEKLREHDDSHTVRKVATTWLDEHPFTADNPSGARRCEGEEITTTSSPQIAAGPTKSKTYIRPQPAKPEPAAQHRDTEPPPPRDTESPLPRPQTEHPGRPGKEPLPAAAWFPDPCGAHRRRYWNGHEWTSEYLPGLPSPVSRTTTTSSNPRSGSAAAHSRWHTSGQLPRASRPNAGKPSAGLVLAWIGVSFGFVWVLIIVIAMIAGASGH